MASRENQGAHIAAICFAIGFVLTLVLTYVGFKQYGDQRKENAQLVSDKQKLQTEMRDVIAQRDRYKEMIGMTPEDQLDAVEAAFKKDLEDYAKSLADDRKYYRPLVESLANEKELTEQREKDAIERARELNEQWQTQKTNLEKQLAAFQHELDESKQDAEQERRKFQSERERITKEKEELAARLRSTEDKMQTEIAAREAKIKEVDNQIRQMEAVNNKIATQVRELTKGSFDVPDGRIERVNQGSRTVWINLGRADGLPLQVTFSVYDIEANNALTTPIKAKVEVTRLLGAHLAEATVLSDEVSDPITAGDKVYSPVWQRGRRTSFALAGFIDIDGDDRDDHQQVRELIQLNGGVIDAEIGDDGQVKGEITVNTRFLVVGDPPTETGENSGGAALPGKPPRWEAYSSMVKDAQNLGVEQISVHEFLDRMGWQPGHRTVRLGPSARPEDFFRQRQPGLQLNTPRSEQESLRPRYPRSGTP